MSEDNKATCSLCNSDFDLDSGGITGTMGIVPVAFCCWCRSSLFDMHEQMRTPTECPECGWFEGDSE